MYLIISFILWLAASIFFLMGFEGEFYGLPYLSAIAAVASLICAILSAVKKKTLIGTTLLTLLNLLLLYFFLIALFGQRGEFLF